MRAWMCCGLDSISHWANWLSLWPCCQIGSNLTVTYWLVVEYVLLTRPFISFQIFSSFIHNWAVSWQLQHFDIVTAEMIITALAVWHGASSCLKMPLFSGKHSFILRKRQLPITYIYCFPGTILFTACNGSVGDNGSLNSTFFSLPKLWGETINATIISHAFITVFFNKTSKSFSLD